MNRPDPELDKTLADLEWPRIEAAVAARCRGPLGARLELPLATGRAEARRALDETAEVLRLLEEDEALPFEGARELGPALTRVAREGSLDGPALRDVMIVLGCAKTLRRFLHARRERMPHLADACAFDPTLDRLQDELSACIEPDGTLSDRASPELRRLRGEVSALRERILRRLEQMLVAHDAILQDRFVTEREGRYVIPVRRDAHEKLQGIVHGTSASGATVFVEPRALVSQGNHLKMLQGELAREEARILAQLSELVREQLPSLEAAVRSIDHADLRQASARLGRDLDARVLPLADGPELSLREARHPILLLDGVDVVPADLELAAGRGLVLSGPNAGGKTVALKVVGLSALMMRAGLPVPAAEGSRAGFFSPIASDVGDEQSIEKNLSTFSAHVTNLSRLLASTRHGALVLLDELAGGTDPQEGSALACALVDAFLRRGAALAVTTHYEALKAMAARDERLENAAVGFDVERMQPTFALHHGVPGASSALAVAQRFGIPADVVAVARGVLPEQSRTFDELVRSLDTQRQELAVARARLDDERAELTRRAAKLDEAHAALAAAREKVLDTEAEKLRDALRRAREDVRQARRLLKKAPTEATVSDVKRRIEEAAKATAARPDVPSPADHGPPVDPATLALGARVWVPRLRTEAEVVEGPTRGKVRVGAGALRLWVDVKELRAPAETARAAKASLRDEAPTESPEHRPTPRVRPMDPDNTLDVRGMRADDAVSLAESFLDRMYGSPDAVAYILHGVGTGALREVIRDMLRRDMSYVRSFRGGTPEEGGDRLTVVQLK
ncbi:MAG: Smr/MutS family protein [Myxococcales bacterium]|nr:Smr/MutS family protein [Myxococcales bacterium]